MELGKKNGVQDQMAEIQCEIINKLVKNNELILQKLN